MALAPNTKPIQRPKSTPTKAQSQVVGQSTSAGSEITNDDQRYTFRTGRDLIALINSGNATAAVRTMTRTSDSTVSSDVSTKSTIANSGFKVTAFNATTLEFDADATIAAGNVLKSLGRVYDYTKGFVAKPSVNEVLHRLLVDVQITGAPALELVMDSDRLPSYISTMPYDYIKKIAKTDGTWYPRQALPQQDEIDLNYPTIFISEMLRDSGAAYSISPIIPALPDVFDLRTFKDDMQRAVNRAGHGRLVVSLDYKSVFESMPEEVKSADKEVIYAEMERVRNQVQDVVDELEPQDALVTWDSASAEVQDGSGSRADYKPLLETKLSQLASALKSNSSALGLRIEGSQSLSNTESLIYLKQCAGIQKPVEDVMTRMLTFACRILGMDVTVDFKFKDINLRPEDELEAFKTSRHSRYRKDLSDGLITDSYFYHITELPPQQTSLSGTGFESGTTQGIPETTEGPQEDALQPDADVPRRGGGSDQ